MLRPLHDHVVIKPDASLPNSVGLFVPDRVGRLTDPQKQIGRRGTVMAVGPGLFNKFGIAAFEMPPVGCRVRMGEYQEKLHHDDDWGAVYVLQAADIEFIEEENGTENN